MTEIPEHLLKRSKERRAAMGLPGGDSGSDAGDGAAPKAEAAAPAAPAKAAAPAKVEAKAPPPPKPDPAHVQAAKNRKRIPFWAMPVIALLPVWAYVYANAVTEPPESDAALAAGEAMWGSCAACHDSGTAPSLRDGEAAKTFPDPVAMMEWIHLGADKWVGGTSGTYGDPNREGGAHDAAEFSSAMPAFDALTAEELAGITRYIREVLGNEPAASPEVAELYLEWAQQAIDNAESGEVIYRDGLEPGAEGDERIGAVAGE